MEASEGAQNGNEDGSGDGAGTGTRSRVETRGRTKDGNGNLSGDGNGAVAGMGTGMRITGTGMRIGSGRAEERRRSVRNRTIVIDVIWKTRETWVERGTNVEKKGWSSSCQAR